MHRADQTTPNLNTMWMMTGQVYLDKAEIRQYYVTRERQSYSLATDYKFNANHSISFKGIYNRRSDWENRYRMTFKKLNDEPADQSIILQTKAGSETTRMRVWNYSRPWTSP